MTLGFTNQRGKLQIRIKFCLFVIITEQIALLQWDLFIKDTLGPANLSTVERLSTLRRWKMYEHYREVYFWCLKSVLCREVVYMVSYIGRVL